MKKIGSGWTFDVYEYGNQKVIKKKKRVFSRVIKILKGDPRLIFTLNKTIRNLDSLNKESIETIGKLRNTSFDFGMLANPESISEDGYIQDKCVPVALFLNDDNEMKNIIEKYIEQIKYFWTYGFADTIFNFTINNGLDENGNIVLFDFNEITTNKKKAISAIRDQVWLKRFSFKSRLNRSQKTYFKDRMTEEITVENLEKYWN